MKSKKFFAVILSILCIAVLCVPVSAIESRASAQIAVYSMKVTPITDALSVRFSVTGAGVVDKLGCESIYVYKLVASRWVLVPSQTKLEDDDGMSATNTYGHVNSIHCSSESGVAYKVVVTIFAENSKGRDTRSETFYVTGQ